MNNPIIYRCPISCPIKKNCFILKTSTPIPEPIQILQKCRVRNGQDIPLIIGGPPFSPLSSNN